MQKQLGFLFVQREVSIELPENCICAIERSSWWYIPHAYHNWTLDHVDECRQSFFSSVIFLLYTFLCNKFKNVWNYLSIVWYLLPNIATTSSKSVVCQYLFEAQFIQIVILFLWRIEYFRGIHNYLFCVCMIGVSVCMCICERVKDVAFWSFWLLFARCRKILFLKGKKTIIWNLTAT